MKYKKKTCNSLNASFFKLQIFIAVVMNDEEELVPLKEVLNQWINRVKKQQNKKDRLISEWRHKFNKHQERIIRTHQEDMGNYI